MSDYYFHHHQFHHQPSYMSPDTSVQPQNPYAGYHAQQPDHQPPLPDPEYPYQYDLPQPRQPEIMEWQSSAYPPPPDPAPPYSTPPVQPQPDPDPLYNQPPYSGAAMRPLDNHQPDYQQPRNGHQPPRPDYPPPHTDFQHQHNTEPQSWWQNPNLGWYTPDTVQQQPYSGSAPPTPYHATEYHGHQPVYQPPHQQPSYPQDGQLHPQQHPYQARQPTSWDPPWLRQTTAYQQPSSYEQDMYSPPPPSCWDSPWLRTQQGYSPYDQPPPRPPSCWDPPAHRTVSQPTSWDLPSQHQSIEFQHLDQPLSRQLSTWVPPQTRQPSCWEPPVNRAPQGYSSYDQTPARQSSCWDPPAHRAPQACLTYVQPPPHAADSHHLVAANITPSTAANPPPDSPNLVGEDEEVVQKSSGQALWSNQSKTILGDEAYGHGMPNDDMLASWRLKSNDSSPTKSSRDEHANDGESANSSPSSFSNYGYIDRELVKKEADTNAASVIEEDPVASLEDEEAAAVQEQVKQIKAQEEEFETFELKTVHRKNRTGFEEDKNFHVVLNSVIAGRYHVTEYLGLAAFSTAIQAHDMHTGMDVCVKIIKNNQDFFDQSLDDIKLLDADARLIPPRLDTPCLSIHRVDKIPVLALNYHDPKGPSLVIFDGDDEGSRLTIWCVFDPGGDISPRFSLSTLFVASWFPP